MEQHVSHHNFSFQKSKLANVVLIASLLFDLSSACCCGVAKNCRCNFFGCNCETDEGWCYKKFKHTKRDCTFGCNPAFKTVCRSSKNTKLAEYCPNRRRRLRRSVTAPSLRPYDRAECDGEFSQFRSQPGWFDQPGGGKGFKQQQCHHW